jgi:O-antigen/teichoic acid export membrane protein/D-alanine-D-alanine ligase-like ATP-grasp enzyme
MTVHARGAEGARDTAGQIRGSSLLLVGRLISIAINLFAQILIARHLTTTGFGAFALAYSLAGMGQVAITLGLHRGAQRFISMYDERRAYPLMLGTILLHAAVILALGACLVLAIELVPEAIAGTGAIDPMAIGLLLILVVLAPINAFDDLLLGLFAVFANPRTIFVRRYLLAPGLRLAVVALVVFGNGNATQLAIGYVLASLIGVALYGAMLIRLLADRGILREFRRSRPEVPAREVLGFSIPLLTNDGVWLLLNTFPLVLLTAFAGLQDVAAFQVVKPTATLNLLVASSFGVLYLPVASRLAARHDHHGLTELYWRTAIWTAIITFPIFAVTFSLSAPLTETLFGERYEASGTYLAIMSLGYYVHAALGFNATTLSAAGRVRSVVFVNGIAAGASVLLGLLLIPPLGALGAAISACLTLLVQNGLFQVELRRALGIPLFYRPAIQAYLVVGVAATLLLLVETRAAVGWWSLVLAGVVSVIVVLVTHRALRADEFFPEVHGVSLGLLSLAGRPARRIVAALDLIRSTGPIQAWRRLILDRRWAALGNAPRRRVYERLWKSAAKEIGATIRPVGLDRFELRVDRVTVQVPDDVPQINDQASLARTGDKATIHALLRGEGLPVPDQLAFPPGQLDAAQAFMDDVDGPCVVKTARGAASSQVTTGIETRAQLTRAIIGAASSANDLVIESEHEGPVYRLLFLDGLLLDVLERLPPRVTGDGHSTIGELIDAENSRRIAGAGSAGLSLIRVDLDCIFTLERAGLTLGTVLADGVVAAVKTASNQNGPADNHSVMGSVSSALIHEALEAASLAGLRLAGIDVMTTDPTRSLRETGGVILDVNGTPGLHDHDLIADPTVARPVAVRIVRLLLSPDRKSPVRSPTFDRAPQPG